MKSRPAVNGIFIVFAIGPPVVPTHSPADRHVLRSPAAVGVPLNNPAGSRDRRLKVDTNRPGHNNTRKRASFVFLPQSAAKERFAGWGW